MTRDEKIAEARRMRSERATLSEIAEALGTSTTTAVRWTDPDEAEADRQRSVAWKQRNREHTRAYDATYDREHRGQCHTCDGPMGIGCADDGECANCRSARRHERCLLIVRRWAEGKSLSEIATELGWARGTLGCEFDRMRRDGYDLPYRYRTGKRNGTKHPEHAA